MATNATEKSSETEPADAPQGRRPGLWQAPLFLLGVGALIAVAATRGGATQDRLVEHDLEYARRHLAQSDGDEAAAACARRAIDRGAADLGRGGEAEFLLGSALLRGADHETDKARDALLIEARAHLEEAERLGGLSDGDNKRLQYRLGKVGSLTNDDRARVVRRLEAGVDSADDRAEGYDLLSRAYEQLPEPDLQKAVATIAKLRQLPVSLKPDQTAILQLRSAELLLKLGRHEDARNDLALIGAQAPAALRTRSRLLRARSFEDEGKWSEAASMWNEALGEQESKVPQPAVVLYHLGLCYSRIRNLPDAEKAWEECVREATGDEGPAAELALAEAYLQDKNYDRGVEILEKIAGRTPLRAEWKNSLADINRVNDVFVRAIQELKENLKFEAAVQLATSFERLATPGKAQVLRAEASVEWARSLRTAGEMEGQSRDLFLKAGEAYIESAANAADEGENYWLAAQAFCEGKHWHNAVQALDHVLTHELSRSKETQRPERLSEAYFLLGEAQRQDKAPDAAEKAYTSCLGVVAPTVTYAFRARYQLALLKIDEGKVDEAYDLLDQNTKQFPYAAKADAETKEKTLFALGNLSFQRKNYAKVYGLLEQALEHFPANPDATLAHFQLAESYLQIALQAQQTELIGESRDPSTVESLRKEYTRWLKKAAFEFEALAEFLEKPEGANQLTLECQVDVPFKAAACRFHLNEYDLAAASYEKLYAKYPDRLEGLNALGGAVQCYFLLDQRDKGFDRLKKIREMLTLPTIPEKVRGLWEAWVDEVTARVANTNKRRG